MLRLRHRQLASLAEGCAHAFDRRLEVHLQKFFPRHCAALGTRAVAATVAHGRSRATAHGFRTRRDVAVYVTLIPLLGSHFDVDPLLPWAMAVLRDARVSDPSARVDRLADEAMSYVDRLVGLDDRRFPNVLERFHHAVRRLISSRPLRLGDDDLEALRALLPEKVAALGDAACVPWIHDAHREAGRQGLVSAWARQSLLLFMFALGPRFLDDPQFGWATRAWSAESGDGDDRAGALLAAASRELSSWTLEAVC